MFRLFQMLGLILLEFQRYPAKGKTYYTLIFHMLMANINLVSKYILQHMKGVLYMERQPSELICIRLCWNGDQRAIEGNYETRNGTDFSLYDSKENNQVLYAISQEESTLVGYYNINKYFAFLSSDHVVYRDSRIVLRVYMPTGEPRRSQSHSFSFPVSARIALQPLLLERSL